MNIKSTACFTQIIKITVVAVEYRISVFPIELCKLCKFFCFQIIAPYIPCDRRSMMLAPVIFKPFVIMKNDFIAGAVVAGIDSRLCDQQACSSTLYRYRVKFVHSCTGYLGIAGKINTVGTKQNGFSVW